MSAFWLPLWCNVQLHTSYCTISAIEHALWCCRVLDVSVAKNASLEKENAQLEGEIATLQQQLCEAVEQHASQLEGLERRVVRYLLPDEGLHTDLRLVLKRFQSRLSSAQASAAQWRAKCLGRRADAVAELRDSYAAAAAEGEAIRRRMGPDWRQQLDNLTRNVRSRRNLCLGGHDGSR